MAISNEEPGSVCQNSGVDEIHISNKRPAPGGPGDVLGPTVDMNRTDLPWKWEHPSQQPNPTFTDLNITKVSKDDFFFRNGDIKGLRPNLGSFGVLWSTPRVYQSSETIVRLFVKGQKYRRQLYIWPFSRILSNLSRIKELSIVHSTKADSCWDKGWQVSLSVDEKMALIVTEVVAVHSLSNVDSIVQRQAICEFSIVTLEGCPFPRIFYLSFLLWRILGM